MKLPYSQPDPSGSERARAAKNLRDLATEIARLRPQGLTRSNQEESDYGHPYPANFTKGLLHDKNGLVTYDTDYPRFVEAINSPNRTLFERTVETAESRGVVYTCRNNTTRAAENKIEIKWRGWESPRAGHVYDLEGADSGAVAMAPAPRVGSSELAAEMAEVYSLALLRDVPFTTICQGGDKRLCPSTGHPDKAELSAQKLVDELNKMPFYTTNHPTSSTPLNTDESGLNRFERNRRFARTQSSNGALTPATAFRGSTRGAMPGPYISQFMLIGADSHAGAGDGVSNYPNRNTAFDLQDGYIPYGSLIIDQRTIPQKNCLDFMTDWGAWLDVQNGADFRGLDLFEAHRRFITTPRDLATYVHFDALYQAYLNACLILLGLDVPLSKGFPEPSPSGARTAFATFGPPHILTLVTEVATRGLKAVRRQKFNYHRRARPEAVGGRLTLVWLGLENKLGCAKEAFRATFDEIPEKIRNAVKEHNLRQNTSPKTAMRRTINNSTPCLPHDIKEGDFKNSNLLLPMAFPEGSPMHASYGAGHATVAGGCATMLKAFFEMFESCNSFNERELCTQDGNPIVYVPDSSGQYLVKETKFTGRLTIQGELDKLAANISIGRNMAGVHYFSDYYDSLRMGERIAVSMLMEQAPIYGDGMETTFTSFDGDHMTIYGKKNSCPSLSIVDRNGNPVNPRDWWLRHLLGEELFEDLHG